MGEQAMSAENGRWSIDVAAAQQILATVDSTIDQFDTDARAVTEVIQAASSAVGASQTATALITLVNDVLTADIVAAKAHAVNASTQTSVAVNAYIQGDLEMAQNAANKMDL